MISIGLRATPHEIYYSIVDEKDGITILITCSELKIPISLNFPEKLNFVRKTFKDIIYEYEVKNAGIRITESKAQSTSSERISYEAILQELLANSSVSKYFVGQISNISAKLGFPRENFKPCICKSGDFSRIANWNKYNNLQKEAILVGVAALNL